MKIQCDVCDKAEASVFCTADEAALCIACDQRVHHANKLASKHQRFSLLNPSHHHSPKCDICQERRAFLFCQQDRAVLCRECDLSIHLANDLTKKHNRFLLTGVKLSASSAAYGSAAALVSASSVSNVSDTYFQQLSEKHMSSSGSRVTYPAHKAEIQLNPSLKVNEDINSQLTAEGGSSTSSISEYLIDTLPGWQVEELMEFSAPFGLCKDNEFGSLATSFSTGRSEIWVPEPRQKDNPSQFSSQAKGFKDTERTSSINSNQMWSDDGFTVPQVSQQFTRKRSRAHW